MCGDKRGAAVVSLPMADADFDFFFAVDCSMVAQVYTVRSSAQNKLRPTIALCGVSTVQEYRIH